MIDARRTLEADGRSYTYYSLPVLEQKGVGNISRLPVSLRVLLESVLRNLDGQRIRDEDVAALARWQPTAERTAEVPFVVGRVLLQDFTGVPLLVDLAAMRSAVVRRNQDLARVQPLVPVDLVIDHSVQVDYFGRQDALGLNVEIEMRRNLERYEFLKWGAQAFDGLRIVPPGFGICHQVNLEFLTRGVLEKAGTLYPDSLVGTDSHTPMVNGLGIVGWGVGGIEAEAAMLGQPVYLLLPDVVGVNMTGRLREGVTATDLVLRITELLRKAGVVGKFVEFHGDGAANLAVTDRATIGNMSPEYGATIGYFPVDEQSCRYLLATGRSEAQVDLVRRYYQAQEMFGTPRAGQCDYTRVIDLDLASIEPSVSGPKRPQDRIALGDLKQRFLSLLTSAQGYGKPQQEVAHRFAVPQEQSEPPRPGGGRQSPDTIPDGRAGNTSTLTEVEMMNNRPTPNNSRASDRHWRQRAADLEHGDVVIAAITSCTNTSNPSVMLAAGLLAKRPSSVV
jgi:aconitate hydratase